jgi:hypothetical protein
MSFLGAPAQLLLWLPPNSRCDPRVTPNPLDRFFAAPRRRRLLWLLAIGTVAFGIAALPSLGTMEDHGVGILELEFVGGTDKADEVTGELGSEGRSAARTSLFLDYPYLICYGLFLAGACVAVAARAARRGRRRLAAAGPLIAWGGLGAAAMDAIENAALLLVLDGQTGQPFPAIASGCAAVKFALAATALIYALIGWAVTASGANRGANSQQTNRDARQRD